MKFNIEFNYTIDIKDCNLNTLINCFNEMKKILLNKFIQDIIVGFGNYHMAQGIKPFYCEKCGNNENFIWKTRKGKTYKNNQHSTGNHFESIASKM